VFCALLCALAAIATPAAISAPAPAGSPGLQYLGTQHLSPRLEELTFSTPALAAPTKVRVLLPSGYDPSGRTRYPMMLLLHGANESYTAWTTAGHAEQITAGYPLIVVMPDGGVDGGYQDWYNGGAGGPPAWETYHIGQLLPWIDGHFPTVGTRAGRAVAGVSMGGGGSMHYAAAHPDLFAAAASFSGAVDNGNFYMQQLDEATGVPDAKPPGSACGLWQTDEVRCRGVNALDLAENLKGLFLQVDTGDGYPGGPDGNGPDLIESGVYQQSVSFHEKLQQLGIAHVWDYYGPGGHEYYYFDRDLAHLLPRLMQVFAHPRAAPLPFDYTSVAADYSAYGWHLTIARPALEFSELRFASPSGFELHGSGTAHVTTAGYYRAGQALAVGVRNLDGQTTQLLHADGNGRLSLPLILGPGNPYQEYSPEAKAWLATRHLTDVSGQEQNSLQSWPVYTAAVSIKPLATTAPTRSGSGGRHAVAPRRRSRTRHHRRRRAHRRLGTRGVNSRAAPTS
jgi:S-formylglutathione hydrolase FrmB